MPIRTLRKNLPVTLGTLIALGVMCFLFFVPSQPEESLEFYTPEGAGAGSFRVTITETQTAPPYTEVKIIPEDMPSFQRFMQKFRNKRMNAAIPAHGRHMVVPGKDIQCDGLLRLSAD